MVARRPRIAKIWRGVQQRLDLVVNLGRANAHTTGVERRIALAVDHEAPMLRRLAVVAVLPNQTVAEAIVKVGRAVPLKDPLRSVPPLIVHSPTFGFSLESQA